MKIIVYLGTDINGFFNDYAFIDAENNNMFKAKDNETGVWFGAYPGIAADNFEIGEWNDGPLEGEDTWQHALNGSLDGTSWLSGDVEGALEFYLGDIEPGGSRSLALNYSLEMKENLPPVASFTCTPESPVVNETIVSNASRSYDPDEIITNYEWDFGDGNSTNTTHETINHSYSSAGDYVVNLTVTDDDDATNTTSTTIRNQEKSIFDTGPGIWIPAIKLSA